MVKFNFELKFALNNYKIKLSSKSYKLKKNNFKLFGNKYLDLSLVN